MTPLSLRWRMTLWYGVAVAACLLTTGVALAILARHVLSERMDHALREELREISLELEMTVGKVEFQKAANARFFHHDIYEFAVFSVDGHVVFLSAGLQNLESSNFPAEELTAVIQTSAVDLPDGSEVMVAGWTKESSFGPLIVLSVTSLNPVNEEVLRLESMIAVVFPLVTLIALSGGYWLSGRALNPVRELALAASTMSINSLDKRVPVRNPHDEIGQLATTLNSLISRLETAVAEIRRFTADASHEIRTPLAAIRMEAELALSRLRSDNEYRQALSVVVEEVSRLGRLADQLLDLSRHDAGMQQKCTDRVNLSHVLHETVEQLTGISKSRGVKLTLDCQGIPVAPGDELRLRQAFSNILENAIKYTNSGGSVAVCCKVQHKQIRIEFQDTGIGIPAEHISKLFERFYRVDESRSQNTGGAGLGLPIARAHVQSCSGEISITSKPGVGTMVLVVLPALDECDSKAEFTHKESMAVAGV